MAHTAPMRKVHADLLAMIDAYALAVKTACIIASCGFAMNAHMRNIPDTSDVFSCAEYCKFRSESCHKQQLDQQKPF